MSSPPVEVSVVLPCLNEQGSVGACVKKAREALERDGLSFEVIVCDNGSTDDSVREASEAGARVVSESRRGYGSAYLTGLASARGRVVVLADADGTYPLDEVPLFARRAAETDGLVLGSRFGGRILPGAMPFMHRFVGSPATRLLLRVLFGVRCSDPHSGMRAMRRPVFDRVKPTSRGMEFAIEMIVNASRLSVPIIDVPITYATRAGDSKLRALPDGWALLRFLLLHSPTFLYVAPGVVVFALGVSSLAWLAGGDRSVGSVTLGANTMVVGSLATIVGYQLVALGVCASTYVSTMRDEGETSTHGFTLERGLVIGGVVLLVGTGLFGSVGARWIASDFGQLARTDHGVVIVGLTVALLGVQTMFSSFFLSLLVFEGRNRRT